MRNPPRSCDLPGGFFAPFGEPRPLPLGEVALRSNDGEGKPVSKEHLHSDKHWLLIESSYRCVFVLSQHPSPLSRACARQLPQRGSPWHVGQLPSGRAKHNISETAVLRCLVQRQLDKERCPEAAAPVSKARPFASCRTSGVQHRPDRPAKASPFGRGVTEGDGEGKPGRKEPLRGDRQAFCQSDTIAVSELFGSGLALSVGLAPASSPKGGAFGGLVERSETERAP